MTKEEEQDAHKVLDIPHSATDEQIRRAYKKQCLLWHPDKHPGSSRAVAERNFKNITLAYTKLTSSSIRPPQPLKSSATQAKTPRPAPTPTPAFANFDTFCDFTRADAVSGPDIIHELSLTLHELFTGVTRRRRIQPDGPILTIRTHPGYRPGDRVRFRDAHRATKHTPARDLVYVITQRKHETYTLQGDDLRTTIRINLVDALAGAVLLVRTLEGRDVKVAIDCVIRPGYEHRVPQQGMPRRKDASQRGDMIVSFDVVFPARVEVQERAAVRELFARIGGEARGHMRRSSSLFSARQSPPVVIANRRASNGAQEGGDGEHGGGAGEKQETDTEQKRGGCTDGFDVPGKIARGKMKFTAIFR